MRRPEDSFDRLACSARSPGPAGLKGSLRNGASKAPKHATPKNHMGKLRIHFQRSFRVRATIKITDVEGTALDSATSEWCHDPLRDPPKTERLELRLSMPDKRQVLSRQPFRLVCRVALSVDAAAHRTLTLSIALPSPFVARIGPESTLGYVVLLFGADSAGQTLTSHFDSCNSYREPTSSN